MRLDLASDLTKSVKYCVKNRTGGNLGPLSFFVGLGYTTIEGDFSGFYKCNRTEYYKTDNFDKKKEKTLGPRGQNEYF